VLTLTTKSRPLSAAATFSISGATIRHGAHQDAQKSTRIGTGQFTMRSSNCA
jgi:hypothetical protein